MVCQGWSIASALWCGHIYKPKTHSSRIPEEMCHDLCKPCGCCNLSHWKRIIWHLYCGTKICSRYRPISAQVCSSIESLYVTWCFHICEAMKQPWWWQDHSSLLYLGELLSLLGKLITKWIKGMWTHVPVWLIGMVTQEREAAPLLRRVCRYHGQKVKSILLRPLCAWVSKTWEHWHSPARDHQWHHFQLISVQYTMAPTWMVT